MSQSELGQEWARCMADVVVKSGRMWPLALGSGRELGVAYSNCQPDFQAPYLLHGKYAKVCTKEQEQ
ncbi:MICOS complex subunit MIC10-like [Tupaia chinensis]|uniref:MICOS complex subunit MIC10-like n=1 Tax=Tupaia chinensis TaxID=246437 RepID=UPI000FFB3D6A|nr:MICOS complex subunit MIC10-like [Tupaia chinensis]